MDKGGWVAVMVALITALGVVASKYLEVEKPGVAAASATPAPAPTPAAVVTPAPVAAQTVAPAAAPVASPVAAAAAPVAPAPVEVATAKPSLDGIWTETTSGAAYRMDDNGNGSVTICGDFGPVVVIGQGRYTAGVIGWTYSMNTGEMGRCQGTLPTPSQIQATCENNRSGTSVVMFRKT
ncbi:hypothetical protein KZX46_09130 [Polymorphobacter sp. PAMC 29334]|uniref:hypothetical protein n=1 Tax=Polymorphobacter sp. PAMC 29334 TaxID=2862331 RepID=UPI001C77AFB9|nr:hypothetical protein [Polymorphobacter sp. PAMC 29334]QYE36074.1 hypothetical protein KZX46_09130 [Polymorphobacter sp. PAMC 29334]